jgi:2-aminobenzoate-CoA ligase
MSSRTGIDIIDGIGSTEMLHIFISADEQHSRPGATGIPVPGYQARVVDGDGRPVPPGTVGQLAVKGPTGCRYLADDRQETYVKDGWNYTGDSYLIDHDGYFRYQARTDDMIVSAGYNIAPYKYPRQVAFAGSLPPTQTGKLQRFKLHQTAPGADHAEGIR